MSGRNAECTVGAAVPPRTGGIARPAGWRAGRLAGRGALACVALAIALAGSPARAQPEPGEPPTPEAVPRAYSVRIEGPDLLLARALERDLDLLRWRDYRGMTRELRHMQYHGVDYLMIRLDSATR